MHVHLSMSMKEIILNTRRELFLSNIIFYINDTIIYIFIYSTEYFILHFFVFIPSYFLYSHNNRIYIIYISNILVY